MELQVIKKNGTSVSFNLEKIADAIESSAKRVIKYKAEDLDLRELCEKHSFSIGQLILESFEKNVTTEDIHSYVLAYLASNWPIVYTSYSSYRNYRKEVSRAFDNAREKSEQVLYVGDNENANKDSGLNSTKQALIANNIMREYMGFELHKDWLEAHESGWIHIHDLAERYLREQNCCLFNMAGLLEGGFSLNGARYLEPKRFDSAINIIGDVTLSASAQQYGGFTIPEFDTVLARYAEKSYQRNIENMYEYEGVSVRFPGFKHEMVKLERHARAMTINEIKQGIQGFETKLNTISNSLGQIPFVTITFGMDTSEWGREIAKMILSVREEGMGENKTTAIFPKLIFLHRKEINGDINSPNYDIKKAAIECSKTRLYPDYLSLDAGHIGEVYERSGKIVSAMGCRAYLSPAYDDNGEEVYVGRSNIGAVTLNLPKIALESKGNWTKFYSLVNKYSQIAFDVHEDYYTKISKTKGSTNPLYFCEGGAWTKIGYEDNTEKIYSLSTASLGYIGLYETNIAMRTEESDFQKVGEEILLHLKKLTEDAKIKYNHLYALYSTPAESLCYRFQKINRRDYGEVVNVTDREYITNSFHVPVWKDISVPEKILFEAPYHQIATGGKISYNEFKYGVDNSVLEQAINFAMENGMYYGVNVVSSSCLSCGEKGDFHDCCPSCFSNDIIVITRVCGYLSFDQINGKARYNEGKQQEVEDRVKHHTKREMKL